MEQELLRRIIELRQGQADLRELIRQAQDGLGFDRALGRGPNAAESQQYRMAIRIARAEILDIDREIRELHDQITELQRGFGRRHKRSHMRRL